MVDQKWIEKYPCLFGPGAKDPDEGQGEIECTDLIGNLMAKFTGYGGTFSTWSERHAFIYAAEIGYLHIRSTEDVPPVPEFWSTEAHYWMSGIIMGRAAAKMEEAGGKIPWGPVIIAIVGSLTAGTVYGQQIVSILTGIL